MGIFTNYQQDMRRNFDKQAQFATSAADYIETHESGSEDEV